MQASYLTGRLRGIGLARRLVCRPFTPELHQTLGSYLPSSLLVNLTPLVHFLPSQNSISDFALSPAVQALQCRNNASLMCNAVTSETKILISASIGSSPGTSPSKNTVEGHSAVFQAQDAQRTSVKIVLFPPKWGATCTRRPDGQRAH